MLAKLTTCALVGIDALPVEVEVHTAHGLPKTILVGLPDTAAKDSVHRIERALANLGFQRPSGRTIINPALTQEPIKAQIEELFQKLKTYDIDFADVRGQVYAKRLVVGASGSHHLLTS